MLVCNDYETETTMSLAALRKKSHLLADIPPHKSTVIRAFSSSLQPHDCLEVISLRKKIQSFHVVYPVVARGKRGQIPAKSLRVAGDVEDILRSPLRNPAHDF